MDLVQHDGRQANPARVYLASLAPGGRKGIYYCMRTVASMIAGDPDIDRFPWHRMTRTDVIGILEKQRRQGLAPNTLALTLSMLKRVAEESWAMGTMSLEDYTRIHKVRPPKGSRVPPGRALAREEVREAVDRCLAEPTLQALRDAALIHTMIGCGLRCAEASSCRMEHVQGEHLKVRGKGNKEALQPIPRSVQPTLQQYLEAMPTTSGPLFPRWRRFDTPGSTAMTDSGIRHVLVQRLGDISPHWLRYTFATWLDQDGVSLSIISRLMRHANVSTTVRYFRHHKDVEAAGHDLRL